MRRAVVIAFAAGMLALSAWPEAKAQDALKYWPQWRGPLATGVAPQGDPPVTWSEEQNVKWKVPCPGGGSASPIVWVDKIFVLAAEVTDKPAGAAQTAAAGTIQLAAGRGGGAPGGGGFGGGFGGGRGGGRGGPGGGASVYWKFEVLCFDRSTGKLLWQKTAREEVPHEGHQESGGYACYSPVTDGKNVYAYFGSRGLFCFDFDGNQVWERELGKMNISMQFGEGGSPALFGDKLFIKRDHEGPSSIMALNKLTGEPLWSVDRNEGTSWSTPLVVEYDGKAQVVTAASNRVRSYDPDTGEVIWECEGLGANVSPTPVADATTVYATAGFRTTVMLAIQLGRKGNLDGSDAIRWRVNRGTPYVPSPMLYGDLIYCFGNNNPVLSCIQADTGEVNYSQTRINGLSTIYASPVGAADRVYLASRDGNTAVIKRSKELEILAVNKLDDGLDATPAIVDKELFLRGSGHLYCIAED
jgi:outer membrane protein assembly factor BamB